MITCFRAGLATAIIALGTLASAQTPQQPGEFGPPVTVCGGERVAAPRAQPPANSGPVLYLVVPCFEAQGNVTLVEPATYVHYIQSRISQPSLGVWVPWDAEAERILRDDFRRVWNTNFLSDLKIDTTDYTFANGVIGKIVTFHMEERERVKIVDYTGSKKIDTAKLDERMRAGNAQIRLDTFIDDATVRRAEGVLRDMMKEEGYQYATITHKIETIAGGPKLVHLTFDVEEGPKVKIRQLDFVGNSAVSDGKLRSQVKHNKARGFLSFITGRGVYHEEKFAEDAERVLEYYRSNGYVRANVGEPEVKILGDSSDKKTRWIELRIPVVEGERYRIGEIKFDGNTVIPTAGLRTLFDVKTGDIYSNKKIRDGYLKAKDVYGAGGYWEFTGYPDFCFSDDPASNCGSDANGGSQAGPSADAKAGKAGPAVVDLTLRIQEGKQFFVNRITFAGNTTTRDNVIRREMRVFENAIFNSEGLKSSVRRINQLGYFRPLEEQRDVTVEKTPNTENKVDVKVKLEEQNRNQINFGAGVSQFEGFFGQLSFQTANFLGRGESLTVSLQSGSRAQNYQLAFTEPFLFDRNITGGLNIFRSDIRYISQFTQRTSGASLTLGFPIGRGFTRMFANYSYERVRVTDINTFYQNPEVLARNAFLADALLLGEDGTPGGERVISKITPTITHNTVDHPIFPTSGKRFTVSTDFAGLGGNTSYYKPSLEGVYFWRQNSRLSLGMRGQIDYVRPLEGSAQLPIFERLFLGGEYTIRGFDLRTVGPSDPFTGLVLGGNKSLLFNVEQIVSIAGPVRLIFFADAGQVRNFGERFGWKQTLITPAPLVPPVLFDPFAPLTTLTDPNAPPGEVIRQSVAAFKVSTGAELRFFMPVLNVPFRLIFAYNPSRAGVLDNRLQPQRAFQFRFAVGTTF
jgi:outer membrane protein insertion porin family